MGLGLGHVPALDAVRGIAIVLVLGAHADGVIPAGGLGVDLFFVLSGFLITALLVEEWTRAQKIDLLAFWRRRALRLVPALALMLATFLLFGLLYWNPVNVLTTVGVGASYAMNFVRGLGGPLPAPGLDHLWSLATEEQFYLLWPPLLAVLLLVRVGVRLLVAALVALAAASALWRVGLAVSGHELERLWYMPDTHVDPILLGCAAGLAFSYGLVRRVPRWLTALAAAAGGLCVVGFDDGELRTAIVAIPLFAVAATAFVLACACGNSPFVRAIDQRPLRYLGRISYGLYLWHWPLMAVLGPWLGVAAVLPIAAISYRYVERPFLRRKRTRRRAEVARPELARGSEGSPLTLRTAS